MPHCTKKYFSNNYIKANIYINQLQKVLFLFRPRRTIPDEAVNFRPAQLDYIASPADKMVRTSV